MGRFAHVSLKDTDAEMVFSFSFPCFWALKTLADYFDGTSDSLKEGRWRFAAKVVRKKLKNVWALYRPAITVKAHEPHFVHMIYRTPRLISFSVIIVMRMCFRIGFEIGLFSEPERENIMKNSNCDSGCAI